jgi:hypothetical protein
VSERAPETRRSDAIRSALRYWEPRRALYNGALAAVVVLHALDAKYVDLDLLAHGAPRLFFLAVVANVLYCAAYVVDLFVQAGGLAGDWPWFRPVLLTIGTAFAATIAHWMAPGLFM